MQAFHGSIIRLIGCIALAGGRSEHGEDIDNNEPGLCVSLEPFANCYQPAIGRARAFGRVFEIVRPLHASRNDPVGAALQAPLVVLEREVKHVALLALNAAHARPAGRHGDADFEREPALADLRPAGEDRRAFRDVAGHDIADRVELPVHQLSKRAALQLLYRRTRFRRVTIRSADAAVKNRISDREIRFSIDDVRTSGSISDSSSTSAREAHSS